ncbi:MAG: DUF948 domain-containing protein [Chlamydiales bacterium]|nr:DUF948 domain-containing protein [Chlamydiales bacterium]
MTPIEISYMVMAISALAVTICVGFFLYKASKALGKITDILGNSNTKMERLDPLFNALSNVGEGLELKTAAFKANTRCQCGCSACQCNINSEKKSAIEPYVQLALAGVKIWDNLQTRK